MADTALSDKADSGKAERVCAWCGADISHRKRNARYCTSKCKYAAKDYDRAMKNGRWHHLKQGPREGATCVGCGREFERRDPRQTYCERNGVCWSRAAESKPHIRAARKRYMISEECRQAQRELYRRRSAEAAISMLILPIEEPNQ